MPLSIQGATARSAIAATTLVTAPGAAIVTKDCEVDQMVFCNKTGTAVTVTVTDGNGKTIVNAMNVPGNTTQQVAFCLPGPVEKGLYCAGGIIWYASANNAIDASIMARQG